MKLAAALYFSALLMGGCGGSERPGLLSDAENDKSGQTPFIPTTSGSGTTGPTSSDCSSKSWFGDVIIHSQADVKKLAGYTSVVGDVYVEPATSGDLSDVSSLRELRCLETVFGALTIEGNPSLYDLSGLEKLTQVDTLNVSFNSGMGSLAGPRQLSISSTLRVTVNAALTSLNSGIVSAASLVIQDNPQLSQCTATSLAKTLHAPCSCDGNLDSTSCN
ncbi:MAG TPA: hypothetical protein VFS67_05530 [Polyangiaceae bacterium]|nr:hypothetical protein [Polyangiaceae bacterium]